MVSSLLSTVCLQSAEGISLRTAWFLRLLLLQILFISVDLEIKTLFNVRWGPFWHFLVTARFSIWWSINSSGKIRKHVKDCFSSTVSAFQNLRHDRFWQQVLWSEVRALDLGTRSRLLEQLPGFWEHLQAFWEPLDSHLTKIKTMHMRLYYVIPNGCEKEQQLSTSPSNHVIALGSSLYRFPWFRQHFST